MNDIDIVDKIFEDRFGDEFQKFSSEQEVDSGTRYRRRTKVRKRSRLESPYQLYPPPSQRRKKRSSNFSMFQDSATLPRVHKDTEIAPAEDRETTEEEKVPDEHSEDRANNPKVIKKRGMGGKQPSVYELMQEVIPPQAFANDVLITKSLSLPFLEQIEYLKMHLHKRGMYTLEEIQERHSRP